MIDRCKYCHKDRLKVWGVDMMTCQACGWITTGGGMLLPPEDQQYVLVCESDGMRHDPIVMETYLKLSHRADALNKAISKHRPGSQWRIARLDYDTEWRS